MHTHTFPLDSSYCQPTFWTCKQWLGRIYDDLSVVLSVSAEIRHRKPPKTKSGRTQHDCFWPKPVKAYTQNTTCYVYNRFYSFGAKQRRICILNGAKTETESRWIFATTSFDVSK